MATTTGSKRLLDISANGMAASNNMTYGGLNVATEQYVSTQLSNIVSSAPGALDTLNELAAALGDDPNFATTITTALSGKLSTSHDMTLTLNGDASGSATFTNMGNATLTVVVANDSHTHDGRYYTETEVNNLLAGKASSSHNHNSTYLGITAKAADANLLDGINSDRFVYGKNARGKSIDLRNGNANTSDATNASGFYYGHTVTGMPDTDWWNWITVAGADWSGGDGYMFQIAGSFWGDDYRIRRMTSGTVHDWKNLIHSGNIGSYAVTSESYTQHENTSNLSGFYGGNNNGVVIEDIEVDANGHVTAVGTRDLDGRFAAVSHNHDSVYTKQSAVTNLGTVYFAASSNTAQFIEELDNKGCLTPNKYSTMKVAWDYAGNSNLDTGAGGVIELAGCQIDVITDNSSRFTVTIKRPTTGTGGGSIWVYNNQGSGYSPGWRQIWTSNDFTLTDVSNGVTAHSWGNHANAGYLTSLPSHNHDGRYLRTGVTLEDFAEVDHIEDDRVVGLTNYNTAPFANHNIVATFINHASGGRRAQLFFGDTPSAGAWFRLRQGSGTQHDWYKIWNSFDFTSTNISNWNTAYDNYITGISITGTTTKTITLTQRDGGTISDTFSDLSGAGGDGNDFLVNGEFDPGAEMLTLEVSNQGVIEIPLPGVMTDTDTDTWRGIHDTPVNGATTTSISSNWAFDNVKTPVPANAVFTDNNTTYTAGTGLTLTGTEFSVTAGTYAAASHTHNYLPLSGGTLTGDLRVTNGDNNGIRFHSGGANITSVSSGDVVIQRLDQLRLGSSASWDWNVWAGIKYDNTSNVLYIGGPAASQFTSNSNPPSIDVNFVGVDEVQLAGNPLATQAWVNAQGFATADKVYTVALDPSVTTGGAEFVKLGTLTASGDGLTFTVWGGVYADGYPSWHGTIEAEIADLPTPRLSIRFSLGVFGASPKVVLDSDYNIWFAPHQPNSEETGNFFKWSIQDIAGNAIVETSNFTITRANDLPNPRYEINPNTYRLSDFPDLTANVNSNLIEGGNFNNLGANALTANFQFYGFGTLENLGATTLYNTLSVSGATTLSSTLTASGGINGLTLTNGISGTNFNITGVNQLEIADPGEGIVFKSGASGDMTLSIVDDTTDNILRFSGTGATLQVGTNTVYHSGNLTAGTNVSISASGVISATDTQYSAGSGLDLTGTTFSIEPDLRDGITKIGKDNNNYIAIDADNNNSIDFYISGVWVARMEADGDLHMKGDVVAFSNIFNP